MIRLCDKDIADFAEAITDGRAGRGLARAIQGKEAFRLQDELHKEHLDLLTWYAFHEARSRCRAVPVAGR